MCEKDDNQMEGLSENKYELTEKENNVEEEEDELAEKGEVELTQENMSENKTKSQEESVSSTDEGDETFDFPLETEQFIRRQLVQLKKDEDLPMCLPLQWVIRGPSHMHARHELGFEPPFHPSELHQTFEVYYTKDPIFEVDDFEKMYKEYQDDRKNPFTGGGGTLMVVMNGVDWTVIRHRLNHLVIGYGEHLHSVLLSISGNVPLSHLTDILDHTPFIQRLYLKVNFSEAAGNAKLPELPHLRVLRLDAAMTRRCSVEILKTYGTNLQFLSLGGAEFTPDLFASSTLEPQQYQFVRYLKISAVTPLVVQRMVESAVFNRLVGLALKFEASRDAMLNATPFILALLNMSCSTLNELHLEASHGSGFHSNQMKYCTDWNRVSHPGITNEKMKQLVSVTCPKLEHFQVNSQLIGKKWLLLFLPKFPALAQVRFFHFLIERQTCLRDTLSDAELGRLLCQRYWGPFKSLIYIGVYNKYFDKKTPCAYSMFRWDVERVAAEAQKIGKSKKNKKNKKKAAQAPGQAEVPTAAPVEAPPEQSEDSKADEAGDD